MEMKRNADIRKALKSANVPQWRLAERLGVSEATLVRWFRTELTDETKSEYFKLIGELSMETA